MPWHIVLWVFACHQIGFHRQSWDRHAQEQAREDAGGQAYHDERFRSLEILGMDFGNRPRECMERWRRLQYICHDAIFRL